MSINLNLLWHYPSCDPIGFKLFLKSLERVEFNRNQSKNKARKEHWRTWRQMTPDQRMIYIERATGLQEILNEITKVTDFMFEHTEIIYDTEILIAYEISQISHLGWVTGVRFIIIMDDEKKTKFFRDYTRFSNSRASGMKECATLLLDNLSEFVDTPIDLDKISKYFTLIEEEGSFYKNVKKSLEWNDINFARKLKKDVKSKLIAKKMKIQQLEWDSYEEYEFESDCEEMMSPDEIEERWPTPKGISELGGDNWSQATNRAIENGIPPGLKIQELSYSQATTSRMNPQDNAFNGNIISLSQLPLAIDDEINSVCNEIKRLPMLQAKIFLLDYVSALDQSTFEILISNRRRRLMLNR